jgi:hypothetical protein
MGGHPVSPLDTANALLAQIARHEAQHGRATAILLPVDDLRAVLTDYIAQAQQRRRTLEAD